MARQLDSENGRESVSAQMAARAAEICQKYGPEMGWNQLLQLLKDRALVRFPCEIRFDAEPLLAGEFAHTLPNGAHSEDGFTIYVHPCYAEQPARVPYLVLYQLGLINFGAAATADDAETFGSGALGLTKDQYYSALCELSGQIGGDELV
jgi:hypothetical protein